jgi:hypothetical protein
MWCREAFGEGAHRAVVEHVVAGDALCFYLPERGRSITHAKQRAIPEWSRADLLRCQARSFPQGIFWSLVEELVERAEEVRCGDPPTNEPGLAP